MDKVKNTKLWTPPEVDRVKKLAAQGMTASQIAAEVGRTRNSVIGAIHRNKVQLLTRSDPSAVKPKPPRKSIGGHLKSLFFASKSKQEPYREKPTATPPDTKNYVPFLNRRYDQCKYIVEKRGDNYYCCGASAVRSGWCEFHAAIVYRPFDSKPNNRDANGRSKPVSGTSRPIS